ncbi:His/Gly/Thr/Pro-type tRNA ligase C-terminal domain-containing protein [Paenibacillus sanfengchensis]|uniref:His/Gly/Thr/Pro-type tRNA ligase C-terminal domain-containing protein n=1 Tax=Paenibacillus TaxID=44249 RepID=UPI003A5C22D9
MGDFRNVQEGEACPRSRVLSAVIEQNHDEHGIIWPVSLAPYQVHLVPVSVKDEAGRQLAEAIYERLCGLGVEVLLDDRDERVGVKFKDADLIGLPVRIVVGKEAGEGRVEFVERRFPGVKTSLTVEEVVRRVLEMRSAP